MPDLIPAVGTNLPFCYRLHPGVCRDIAPSSQSDRAGRSSTEGAEMTLFRITRRILTVALVVTALSAPVASAATYEERFQSTGDEPSLSATPVAESPSAETSGGFDWGDAGIGAAAVIAMVAIAGGVALEVSRRRRPTVA
jgi:hypothetical protein